MISPRRSARDAAQRHQQHRVGDAEAAHRQPGGVGAGAEEDALAEGDEAAAHEHHQAERDQPLGERQGGDEYEPIGQHATQQRQRREGDERGAESAETPGHQIFRGVVRWKSPSGRSASTSAITR